LVQTTQTTCWQPFKVTIVEKSKQCGKIKLIATTGLQRRKTIILRTQTRWKHAYMSEGGRKKWNVHGQRHTMLTTRQRGLPLVWAPGG